MSSSPPPLVQSVAAQHRPSSSSTPSGHGSAPAPARVFRQLQDLRISDPSAATASLNPFAKEFVPVTSDSSHDDAFQVGSESTEGDSSAARNSDKRLEEADVEMNTREEVDRVKGNGSQRSGGLSTALKRGNANQSRTPTASRGGLGNADGSSGQKRNQFTNANYLLNFQYDPIVRPPPLPRISYNRKPQKVQPYDKELFLQANFKFLVSDYGDYLLNSSDPDKMLKWEDVAAVNISAPIPVQCPICLECPPVCPQITSCGHIFCFPCILRYLALGEQDHRSDYFKKCPLCFAMTSSKSLRTVLIDDVHNFEAGDYLEFTLLNRAKGSIFPFEKTEPVIGALPYSKEGRCHPFSKFTLTSDADYVTNKAVVELTNWAEKTQNEQSEDMDLLPFVFLAIDQLQQRKSAWNDNRASEFLSSSPPVRQRVMALQNQAPKLSTTENDSAEVSQLVQHENQKHEKKDVSAETKAAMAHLKEKAGWVYENAFSDDEGGNVCAKAKHVISKTSNADVWKPAGSPNCSNLSLENSHELQNVDGTVHVERDLQPESKNDAEDTESYAFYQSVDGQPIIIHPLNMKCLINHYGSYEKLPTRLKVKALEMEGQIQSEATRKRYRYLSHLPLTTNFSLCEVDLRGHIPSSAFSPFIDEIRTREMRRRRRQKQEQAARFRNEKSYIPQSRYSPPAEVTLPTHPTQPAQPAQPTNDNVGEELPLPLESDENVAATNKTPANERKLFSQVTRFGFASAHDAPDLVSGREHNSEHGSSSAATSSKPTLMSFANIIQNQPLKSAPNGSSGGHSNSKKNKKATKILLSTAGGRRY